MPRGILVVDGQRDLSSARAAPAEIQKAGKPIRGIVLTHPHPDHFGGLGVFAEAAPAAPVYASAQTRASIAADCWGLVAASQALLKEDFPDQVQLPDTVLVDGRPVEIDGLTLIPAELGGAEAECMTALGLPEERLLIAADVVQHGMTPFLLEGRSAAWLGQLAATEIRFGDVRTLYPGHGAAGPPAALIAAQRRYLETVRALVRTRLGHGQGGLAPRDCQAVAAALEQHFPDHLPVAAIPDLALRNLEPVAAELLRAG